MLYVQYRYGNSYKRKQTKILFYPPYLRIAQIRTIFLVCYLYSTKALSKLFVITVKERKKDPYQIINTVSNPCCKYMQSFFYSSESDKYRQFSYQFPGHAFWSQEFKIDKVFSMYLLVTEILKLLQIFHRSNQKKTYLKTVLISLISFTVFEIEGTPMI